MSHQQNSRRAFLSNMAILSVGFTVGKQDVGFSSLTENSIKQKWKYFWHREGGKLYNRAVSSTISQELIACKGHVYKQGELVYFPILNLFACPTWIYWKNDSSSPADMIVTFYKKKNECFEKMKHFTRFEMEAIYTAVEKIKDMPVLKDAIEGNLKTKTFVKNNIASHEITYSKGQQIILKHQFS